MYEWAFWKGHRLHVKSEIEVVLLFNTPHRRPPPPCIVSAVFRLWACTIGSVVIPHSSLKPWNDTSWQMNFHWSYNKQSLLRSKWGERVSFVCCASVLKTLLTPHLGFLNIFLCYERISSCVCLRFEWLISQWRRAVRIWEVGHLFDVYFFETAHCLWSAAVLMLGIKPQCILCCNHRLWLFSLCLNLSSFS